MSHAFYVNILELNWLLFLGLFIFSRFDVRVQFVGKVFGILVSILVLLVNIFETEIKTDAGVDNIIII